MDSSIGKKVGRGAAKDRGSNDDGGRGRNRHTGGPRERLSKVLVEDSFYVCCNDFGIE